MKKIFAAMLVTLLLAQGAIAQEAPTPRKMPRTPVAHETLPDRKPAASLPSSHIVQGQMNVIDTERLRLGDLDLRLFGIVPPQLSASFGPQTRAALDALIAGQTVTCLVRDRDQAGRFLATCQNSNNSDLAIELLRRGLAITARGSLSSTELATPYLTAEQAAQSQKIGLWSVITPSAAPVSEAPKVIPAPAPALQPVVIEAKKDTAKEDKALKAAAEKDAAAAMQAKANAALSASALAPVEDETMALPDASGSFLRRYQIFVTGLIMLVTALSILTVVSMQRRREKQDEMKAIAAALRGELMAARAVCQGRMKSIAADTEDKSISWPRIRSTLYQAYVGRLGFLGAELARQVASIYGQASDYSSYYNTASSIDAAQSDTSPKRQALQNLIQYIEEVLPKLASVEQTGRVTQGFSATIMPTPVRSYTMPAPERTVAVEPVVETAVTEVTSSRPSPAPLWEAVRKFRDRFSEKEQSVSTEESDYASIIEAEMANLSFSEMGDDTETLPGNVTKIRNTGT